MGFDRGGDVGKSVMFSRMVSKPSQTQERTRYVPVDAVEPHPKRIEFPHDSEREDIEPVGEGEFLQNPKVTPESHFSDAAWTLISGNRRMEEAERRGGDEVKVDVVGPYDTPDEELRALLDYNDYRSFTPVEKLNHIDAYRNLGCDVEEACKKNEMSTSTYDNGRWIRRAAEEGLWGLQNAEEIPEAAVEVARRQWTALKHDEASIGGPETAAFGNIEAAINKAKREESVDNNAASDPADSQQSSHTPDDFGDGEYGFTPVFGFNEGQVAKKRHEEERGKDVDAITTIGGRELSWWEKESIIPKHGYLLVNPVGFTTADPDRRDFRDLFRYEKGEQFVFSDSGGYQLMSMPNAEIVDEREDHSFQDLDVHPETLLEWQVLNADAGATIDFPPYNISGSSATPTVPAYPDVWERKFYHHMEKSAEMVERMSQELQQLRKKECEDASAFNFCPVLHGRPHPDSDDPHEYMRHWHDAMSEASNVEPDGWVLKPQSTLVTQPITPGQIAMFLGYAAEYLRDVEYLHVLMVGQPLTKALLMYYSMLTGQLVTSDTSSYAQGGESRQFYVPGTVGRRSTMIREGHEESLRLDEHPCKCQICTAVEREYGIEFLTEGNGAARSASMNLHNLHQQLEAGRWMKQQLHKEGLNVVLPDGHATDSTFWSVMRYHYGEQAEDLRRAMCYVRVAHEDGLDGANEEYHIPWKGERGRTIELREQAKPRPTDVLKPRTTMEGHHHIRDMSSVTGWD